MVLESQWNISRVMKSLSFFKILFFRITKLSNVDAWSPSIFPKAEVINSVHLYNMESEKCSKKQTTLPFRKR
ncbi:unnamed protein product [Larinioides sclopetarius]|uniref:Uncharacterized protein n=1 Tax=Larinioides sclopetarius TaxID=280406 RepID=A0AAV1ZX59_9ARAC